MEQTMKIEPDKLAAALRCRREAHACLAFYRRHRSDLPDHAEAAIDNFRGYMSMARRMISRWRVRPLNPLTVLEAIARCPEANATPVLPKDIIDARDTLRRMLGDVHALMVDLQLDMAAGPAAAFRMTRSGRRVEAVRESMAKFGFKL
jgi:hypothetical protein